MKPKIYLFGDSITEGSFLEGGWGASITNLFSRKADVVLRGYGGYNTRFALKVLKKGMVFPAESSDESGGAPLAVTVFFGANDASLPDRSSAFLHVPVDEYMHNLRSIVSFLKERWPTTIVILITPPPIDEEARLLDPENEKEQELPERTNEAAGIYAGACIAVAAECGIPAADIWSKMQQTPGWEKAYLCDGLHLTSAGNGIVFQEVVERLKEAGVNPETLPYHLPHYNDIDRNDPMKVFENLG